MLIGHEINTKFLSAYTEESVDIMFCPYHAVTLTIHKILIHGLMSPKNMFGS